MPNADQTVEAALSDSESNATEWMATKNARCMLLERHKVTKNPVAKLQSQSIDSDLEDEQVADEKVSIPAIAVIS